MEPTIYKPSIYKGTGIYKAGGEGGVIHQYDYYDDYETDFSNFDTINKFDIPNIGYITKYWRDYTFEKNNGLTINSQDVETFPNVRVINHFISNGKKIETEAKFFEGSTITGFFLYYYNGLKSIYVGSQTASNEMAFSDTISFNIINNFTNMGVVSGLRVLQTNIDFVNNYNKFKFLFDSGKISLFINDTLCVELNADWTGDLVGSNFVARKTCKMYIKNYSYK